MEDLNNETKLSLEQTLVDIGVKLFARLVEKQHDEQMYRIAVSMNYFPTQAMRERREKEIAAMPWYKRLFAYLRYRKSF